MVTQYKNQMECALPPPANAELAKGPTSSLENVVPALLSLVGEKVSQSCHPREHEHWATATHAKAYQTLSGRNKTADPTCLPCHPPVTALPKTLTFDSKMSSVKTIMVPQEDTPIPEKTLSMLTKTIAGSVTIQPTAPTSIMINTSRKSFIQE